MQCSIRLYLQNFVYVVIRRIETASYTQCIKSAVMRHKTHEISRYNKVKCSTSHKPTVQHVDQRAACKFNPNVVQNIPAFSFHKVRTGVTRIETASPLSDSCSDCGPAPPTPELIDIRCVRLTSLHFLLHDTPDRIVNRI